MSTPTVPVPPFEPTQAAPLVPPSVGVTIPAQQLDKWFKLPSDQYLNIQITRSDLDRFYNGGFRNLAQRG